MTSRFSRDDNALRIAFHNFIVDEDQRRIPTALVVGQQSYVREPEKIISQWETLGFGRIDRIDTGYTTEHWFEVLPAGEKAFKKAARSERWRNWKQKRLQGLIPTITALAAVIAAVAATASAYFAYLGIAS